MSEELIITLKVDDKTDVRFELEEALPYEKLLKVSNAVKKGRSFVVALLAEKNLKDYHFLFLTTERLGLVSATNNGGRWETELKEDVLYDGLISAKSDGKNLIVNHEHLGATEQLKMPIEKPEQWMQEINKIVEKEKA